MKIKFLLFFLILSFSSNAQLVKKKKFDKAISALNETEFITTYKEYKSMVEETITNFKSSSSNYDSYDVEQVKDAYMETNAEFDAIVETLKSDLLNKKMRSLIIDDPNRYSKFVASELEDAYDNFLNNTVSQINDLSDYEYTGFGPAEIQLILALVTELSGIVKDVNRNLKKMSEAYFEQYFIKDLRLAKWEDL